MSSAAVHLPTLARFLIQYPVWGAGDTHTNQQLYMKRKSMPVSGKCKSKPWWDIILYSLGWLCSKRKNSNLYFQKQIKCWVECGEKGSPCTLWECKLVSLLQTTVWRFFKKLNYQPTVTYKAMAGGQLGPRKFHANHGSLWDPFSTRCEVTFGGNQYLWHHDDDCIMYQQLFTFSFPVLGTESSIWITCCAITLSCTFHM